MLKLLCCFTKVFNYLKEKIKVNFNIFRLNVHILNLKVFQNISSDNYIQYNSWINKSI